MSVVISYNYINYGLINSPWAKLYSKKIIEENNIEFDETLSLGEDLLFNFEYLKKINNITFVNNTCYYYRQGNKNSLSNKYFKNMLDIQKKLCENYCLFFQQNKQSEKANDIVKFCTTIVSNEFHNHNNNILKQYCCARKILDDEYIKEKIKEQKEHIGKIRYFLLSHKFYFTYKIITKIKGVFYE